MGFLFRNLFLLGFLILISIGYFLTSTDAGLEATIYYLSDYVPGKLIVTHANGNIFSKITLQDIFYQNNAIQIHIKSLQLNWNPLGLLDDKLIINKIVLDNPKIIINKINFSQQKNNNFKFNYLPYIIIKQFSVNKFTLENNNNNNNKIEFTGELTKTWNVTWHAMIPHLNTLLDKSSGSINSIGMISGPAATPIFTATVDAQKLNYNKQKIQQLQGRIYFNLQPNQNSSLLLTASGIKINNTVIPLFKAKITGTVAHHNQNLAININLLLMQKYHLLAELYFPKFTELSDFSQAITGKITLASTDINIKSLDYVPELKNLRGKVHGQFLLSGTLAHPLIQENMAFTNGSLQIPLLGIHLDNIYFHIFNNSPQHFIYESNFNSGNGHANLQGILDISPDLPISFKITGNNLQVVNLREYKIIASPKLDCRWIQDHLDIQGNITIPSANILPKDFSKTITLSEDVRFVNQADKILLLASSSTLPFKITLDINLLLGEKIHIAYDNLDTYLMGHVQINQTLHSQPTANGELYAVNGTYHAYGQVLTIQDSQDGRLIYTGNPLTNPGLHIRASKKIKTILTSGTSRFTNQDTEFKPIYAGTEMMIVGVQVEGTANHPIVSLFSVPVGLSQNDILSFLIFGYPQSQISNQQNKMILSAATALNMSGKSKLSHLTTELQNSLGLNELNVESAEVFNPNTGAIDTTPSFVIGKQLAPNLYAHYSIGLFNSISIFNLRYQISKRFALQSETSSLDNGADLLYSIERD